MNFKAMCVYKYFSFLSMFSVIIIVNKFQKNRVVSTSTDAKGNWIVSSDIGSDSSVIVWDANRW